MQSMGHARQPEPPQNSFCCRALLLVPASLGKEGNLWALHARLMLCSSVPSTMRATGHMTRRHSEDAVLLSIQRSCKCLRTRSVLLTKSAINTIHTAWMYK